MKEIFGKTPDFREIPRQELDFVDHALSNLQMLRKINRFFASGDTF